jgi:hypothetical protein
MWAFFLWIDMLVAIFSIPLFGIGLTAFIRVLRGESSNPQI